MSFDVVAPVYDRLARLVFGHRLERAQTALLDGLVSRANVLILGGGTGFLLDALLTKLAYAPARIVYLEASARMLDLARQRLLRLGNPADAPTETVTFRLGNETTLRPDERFELILLPFVLDMYLHEQLQRNLIPRLLEATQPGGHWLVTDFVETRPWAHRLLRWTMFRFFRLLAGIPAQQLPDWPQLLTDAGLVTMAQKTDGMVRSVRLQRPE
jgi:tRNA (cmo5U34)-methyltransferase